MWRICPECGNEFFQDEPWKKICIECWKDKKRRAGPHPRETWEQRRIHELESKVQCLEIQLELARQRMLRGPEVPHEFVMNLKKIISLCHPDRHGGSRTANEITSFLNNIRDHYRVSHGR